MRSPSGGRWAAGAPGFHAMSRHAALLIWPAPGRCQAAVRVGPVRAARRWQGGNAQDDDAGHGAGAALASARTGSGTRRPADGRLARGRVAGGRRGLDGRCGAGRLFPADPGAGGADRLERGDHRRRSERRFPGGVAQDCDGDRVPVQFRRRAEGAGGGHVCWRQRRRAGAGDPHRATRRAWRFRADDEIQGAADLVGVGPCADREPGRPGGPARASGGGGAGL